MPDLVREGDFIPLFHEESAAIGSTGYKGLPGFQHSVAVSHRR